MQWGDTFTLDHQWYWDQGNEAGTFLFFKLLCFVFAHSHWFSKESDEKQIIDKVHPDAENCLVFSTSRHYMDAVTKVEEDDKKQSIHWKRCGGDSPRFRIASPWAGEESATARRRFANDRWRVYANTAKEIRASAPPTAPATIPIGKSDFFFEEWFSSFSFLAGSVSLSIVFRSGGAEDSCEAEISFGPKVGRAAGDSSDSEDDEKAETKKFCTGI